MKYNIVSGWRRGGTSVMMLALNHAGIPIVGFKYPFAFDFDYIDTKEGKVIQRRVKKDGGLMEPLKPVKDSNPNGFWEVPSICLREGVQKKHSDFGKNGDLIKVPADVLPASNPTMVDKVVLMMRNPRKVIASLSKTQNNRKEIKAYYREWVKAMSLGMLHNMVGAFKWLDINKKEYIIVEYENLLENPEDEIEKVCDFLERGDPLWGAKIIEKKLDRSNSINDEIEELKELEKFYRYRNWKKYNLNNIQKKLEKLSAKYNLELKKV